jgi:membrane-associated phospholipid phosphatase
VFLCLILHNFQNFLKNNGRSLLIPFLQVILVISAILIGLSRISNYVHHWSDVLTGAILGSCAGYFGFYLFEKECKILHVEHKPRDRESKSDNEGPLDMDV